MNLLLIGAQSILVVVFAVAAYSKWKDLAGFAGSLEQLGLVRGRAAYPVGVLVAILESVTTVLLPWPAPWGFALAVAMMAAFSIGVAWIVRQRIPASCRCFGASGGAFRPDHLMRNLALTGVAVLGLALSTTSQATPHLPSAGFAVAIGVSVALLAVRWDDFLYTIRAEQG